MRRFSQRSGLVTLAEINITPLLDLAFVLLIIFVITTPLLEQGLNLKLPGGGKPDRPLQKGDVRTVDISPQGVVMLSGHPVDLNRLESELRQSYRANPRLVAYIRADEGTAYRHLAAVLDRLERIGIDQVSLRTEPRHR